VPVVELLTPSDGLRDAIGRGATALEIRTAMRAAGFPTMRDRALQLVAAGVTSIEEVNRVLTDNTDSVHAAARERKRVLVTDDEPITRMLVKLLLERTGTGFAGSATPEELATAVGALRPVARETTSLILAQEVERALRQLVDRGPEAVVRARRR